MRPLPTETPARIRRDETGAALILVLVFLLVGGLVVGALLNAVGNDLTNTSNFASARSLQYDASSATDLAIQSIRYSPLVSPGQTLNASPPAPCWGSGANSQYTGLDGNQIAVWCSTVWNPTSANTRVVTLSACLSGLTAAACATNPLLQAVVTFDDYPPGLNGPTTAECVVYCGTSMTVNSWVQRPVVPTVSTVYLAGTSNAATGPITGGTSMTITGSGFVSGSTTVNLIQESGGTPSNSNVVVIVPATSVTVSSSTSVTVASPAVTAGTTYFVTVTTPSGTSADSASAVFTYTATLPTVIGVSPSTGSTAGATTVAVSGTGFMSGATVNFVEESGGSPVSPQVSLPATYVTVLSGTSLTAVSPPVTAGTQYFVLVTTPGGTNPSNTNDVFTYTQLVPTVSSISPTSGPPGGGTLVTIIGTGFGAGDTINFEPESNGTVGSPTLYGTAVTVISATQITADSPATTKGTTYFVTVTNPNLPSGQNTSDPYPVFLSATPVTNVTFTGSSHVQNTTATWTVGLTTSSSGALAAGNTITATFNTSFTVPATPTVTLSTGFTSCTVGSATSSGGVVTITLAGNNCAVANSTAATLTIAGITNPAAASYANTTFNAATSQDVTAANPASAVTITTS